MKTECPHCGQHYEVDNEYIGQVVECTTCGKEFAVKAGSDVATIQAQRPGGKMKALVCEMCGSTDLIKQNGLFVCQSCGIKYSLEEARKMMIDGTVNVAGTVKVDMSEKLKNLYTLARRARDENNSQNAAKYYDLILLEDPQSWEASFYQVYYKAMLCEIENTISAASAIQNRLKNTLTLISQSVQDETERDAAFCEVTDKATEIALILATAAAKHFTNVNLKVQNNFKAAERTNYAPSMMASAQICYTLGDLLESFKVASKLSCRAWKRAISIHVKCVPYQDGKTNCAIIERYTAKIRRTEHGYKHPAIPSGCYIATAVYGSYDCPEVWTLRRFRDYSLGKSWYGRYFIKMYYAISPKLVKLFGHTRLFQLFWKKELDKLVKKLNRQGVSSAPYVDKNY